MIKKLLKSIAFVLVVAVIAGVMSEVALLEAGGFIGSRRMLLAVGVKNFLALSDTPLSYSGEAGKLVMVNSGETALEFSREGLRLAATQYGAGLWLHLYGEDTAEHTNQTGSLDYTGGAFDMLFTKTAGDDFTQADADNGNWILMTGANLGAIAEIKTFVSATTVIVEGLGWTGDLASQTFLIYKHPSFISGENAQHEFSVEATGELEIESYGFTGDHMVEILNRAAADGSRALRVAIEGNGYDLLDGIHVQLDPGDLQPGDTVNAINIGIDETGAASSDATTTIEAISLETTNATIAVKHALHIGTGFDSGLTIAGASAEDPDYGYEVTSGSVVTRTAVFTNTASDVEIFDNDNDYILIGSDSTFEVIEADLQVNSSKDVDLAYYYSKAGGAWTALTIDGDNTNGFRQSGEIRFDAPGDWTKDDEAEINGDVTNAYYIKLLRQYNTPISTLPTEDMFQTYSSESAGMEITGSGLVILPYLTGIPTDVANGAVWMESDGLHVYYNGAERLVSDGAP